MEGHAKQGWHEVRESDECERVREPLTRRHDMPVRKWKSTITFHCGLGGPITRNESKTRR